MLRLSYWQWERHLEKKAYIENMEQRLEQPIQDISEILNKQSNPEDLYYRRVSVTGKFDFTHEVTLSNRSFNEHRGVHVLTPLKITKNQYILVDRGFLPLHLAKKDQRQAYHKPSELTFVGLIKEGKKRGFFLAPKDPETGKELPWIDSFLRVDISKIEKQLPYQLLPFYLEIMSQTDSSKVSNEIVKSSSGKNDIFYLPSKEGLIKDPRELEKLSLPIATFDTVIPPGRHFGYVFEWAIMAFATLLIAVVLQLRPARHKIQDQHRSDNLDK